MPRDGELTLLQRYRELRWLLLFNRALASRRGAEPDLLWAVGVQESNLSLQYLECLAGHMQPKSKMFDLWPHHGSFGKGGGTNPSPFFPPYVVTRLASQLAVEQRKGFGLNLELYPSISDPEGFWILEPLPPEKQQLFLLLFYLFPYSWLLKISAPRLATKFIALFSLVFNVLLLSSHFFFFFFFPLSFQVAERSLEKMALFFLLSRRNPCFARAS